MDTTVNMLYGCYGRDRTYIGGRETARFYHRHRHLNYITKNGCHSRHRTYNDRVNSSALYQLSYVAFNFWCPITDSNRDN